MAAAGYRRSPVEVEGSEAGQRDEAEQEDEDETKKKKGERCDDTCKRRRADVGRSLFASLRQFVAQVGAGSLIASCYKLASILTRLVSALLAPKRLEQLPAVGGGRHNSDTGAHKRISSTQNR